MKPLEGRFITSNGSLVASHVDDNGYKGHIIKTKAPWKDCRTLYWDSDGRCLSIDLGDGVTIGGNTRCNGFDLVIRVNPQTIEDQIECVDCEECREYAKSKGPVRLGVGVKEDHVRGIRVLTYKGLEADVKTVMERVSGVTMSVDGVEIEEILRVDKW